MSDIKTIHLEGPVRWAKVQSPVPTFDQSSMQYEIEIGITDEKFEELKSMGLSSKRKLKSYDDDDLKYLKLTRPTVAKSGKEMSPPVVVDGEGQAFEGLIGNGSQVRAAISAIPYDNQFGKGVKLILAGVKIKDLVEYKKDAVAALFGEETSVAANDDEDLF